MGEDMNGRRSCEGERKNTEGGGGEKDVLIL